MLLDQSVCKYVTSLEELGDGIEEDHTLDGEPTETIPYGQLLVLPQTLHSKFVLGQIFECLLGSFLALDAIAEKKVSISSVDAFVAVCEVMSRMSSKCSRDTRACWQRFANSSSLSEGGSSSSSSCAMLLKPLFVAVDVGAYGEESDSQVFQQSAFGKKIRENNFTIPPSTIVGNNRLLPHALVGDGAFALSQTMMKPYSHKTATAGESKRIFSYRLCRTRRTSENAFGILGQVFRILINRLPSTRILLCTSIARHPRQKVSTSTRKYYSTESHTCTPATLRMWVNEFANNSQNTSALKAVFHGRLSSTDGDSYLTSTDRRATDSPVNDQSLPEVPDRPLHTGFYRRATVRIFSELPLTLAMASHAL
ncbi:hypothetical protein PR048_019091 [Dryococelus australis]|uniref:DDE Tnp4 domain-containing protein n=1 Tax=Dryococelus australis TaxID=614101 RepID=A0ABQ9H2V1_9NEOP|nr:hypothetical protein PR048_019091 [Dryococelus australis]